MNPAALVNGDEARPPDGNCLSGGGKTGALLRAIDWSVHPLGPPANWPVSLQTAVRLLLASQFPMLLHWGPGLHTFYNDAYAPNLGAKHPDGLGSAIREWWTDLAESLQPTWDRVLAGESIYTEEIGRAHV